FQPISSTTDWQPEDYQDSRGILAVTFDGAQSRLILDAHLVGGNPSFSKGEALLDLRYVADLDALMPLDMSRRTLTATVAVPAGFVGPPSTPNGVQVIATDAAFHSAYGPWLNVTAP